MAKVDFDTLKKSFDEICDFCGSYPSIKGGLPTQDSKAIAVINNLDILADWLKLSFSEFKGVPIKIVTAEGAGAFPRVPWICLLPPSQRVNDGIYVAICFGKGGNGAVAGCAESATAPKALKTIQRSGYGKVPTIDIDGASKGTQYNNVFQNPLEVFKGAFDPDNLASHIANSLELALQNIQSTPVVQPSPKPKPIQVNRPIGAEFIPGLLTDSEKAQLSFPNLLALRLASSILQQKSLQF